MTIGHNIGSNASCLKWQSVWHILLESRLSLHQNPQVLVKRHIAHSRKHPGSVGLAYSVGVQNPQVLVKRHISHSTKHTGSVGLSFYTAINRSATISPNATQVCFELNTLALIPLVGVTIALTRKPEILVNRDITHSTKHRNVGLSFYTAINREHNCYRYFY